MEKIIRKTILDTLREFSTPDRPVYLVGGAVRDLLLDRAAHDLDFVLPGETRKLAQEIANRLNGAFYMLDEERDTTRVVLETPAPDGERMLLDFATLRAVDLEADLRARDFTINAMAFDVARPAELIDPTGGLNDLREKRLRACSRTSLSSDPVRVLRAVRQSITLQLRIEPETLQLIRAAAPRLTRSSAERLRDELFRMLDGEQVTLAIRLLDEVGALPYLLPDLEALKGVTQSDPHISNVWDHTLNTVQALEQLLQPLVGPYHAESAEDVTLGMAVLWLGRFRERLDGHLRRRLVPDRSLRALLFLAALYHDIAKPQTRSVTAEGRVRFLDHTTQGVYQVAHRARELALSAAEVSRLETVVGQHMRVHFLLDSSKHEVHPKGEESVSRRSIYRFFKDTGEAGVDICLLTLADTRATYGVTLPPELWQGELQICRALLEAYWEKSEEVVSPPRFLSGNDLMALFEIKPGRMVGRLLSAIREAQAAGEVHNRAEAEAFAHHWLDRYADSEEISRKQGEG